MTSAAASKCEGERTPIRLTADQQAWAASRLDVAHRAADRYAARYRADRDEIRSDACLKICELAGQIDADDSRSCDGYVFTCVSQRILDISRSRHRIGQKFTDVGQSFAFDAVPDDREPGETEEDTDERHAEYDELAELVRGLPDRLRAVVVGRIALGRSYAEIAEEWGVKAKTVRIWKMEAIERLRMARAARKPKTNQPRKERVCVG